MKTFVILIFLTIGASNAVNRPPNSICENRPVNYFVRDFRQCNAFFRCSNQGIPVWGTCQTPGSVFDERTQRCVWPSQTNCFSCPAGQSFVQLEVENACRHYVRCIDGQPQHMDCGPGLMFDSLRGTCNLEQRVSCGLPATVQCPVRDDPINRVWWRDDDDCSVYAVCVNGQPERRACADGLNFNMQTFQCDLPHNVNCPSQVVFRCEDQEPLPVPIYPHPTDCTRYFICNGLVAIPEQCPPETRFDIVQRRCDSFDRAVCAPGAHNLKVDSLSNSTSIYV